MQDAQVGRRDVSAGRTPFSAPSHLSVPNSRHNNLALAAWLSTASHAHPCPSPARIASDIVLLLLDFVSQLGKKVKLRHHLKEFGLFLPCIWAQRFYLPVIRNTTFSSPQ